MDDKAVAEMTECGDENFWQGKRVLITGHSGFKGAWLALWLHRAGAQVFGISLPPETQPSLFASAKIDELCHSNFCNILDLDKLKIIVEDAAPDIAFHLAAQPLVKRGYAEPLTTFNTNVMGTANILEALRGVISLKSIVVITTDKVYRSEEWCWPYRETDRLGGADPYSASKAACEILVDCYRQSYFQNKGIALSSVRGGNVIGGGDWSDNRIIPDLIRAWLADIPVNLRQPNAIRPWQHVLETVNAYTSIAKNMCVKPNTDGEFNIGPNAAEVLTVGKVAGLASKLLGNLQVIVDHSYSGPKETSRLTLDNSKVNEVHGIVPVWHPEEAISKTINWYKNFSDGINARDLCYSDMDSFFSGEEKDAD